MLEDFEAKVEAALEAETQYDHGLPWAQFADRVGAEPKRKRMRAILSAAFSEGVPNSLAVLNRLVRSLESSGTQLKEAQEAAYEGAASFLDGALAPGGEPKADEHWSDCATNSAPALPVGPCNCGATALSEARAEGRRQGLEEAAIRLETELASMTYRLTEYGEGAKATLEIAARDIRSLATNTPETQKPETGESGR